MLVANQPDVAVLGLAYHRAPLVRSSSPPSTFVRPPDTLPIPVSREPLLKSSRWAQRCKWRKAEIQDGIHDGSPDILNMSVAIHTL